jgi:glycosyltransferase involved in cell wall biosynthesis
MSMNQRPSISLLIPCFNGLQHLPKLIESVQQLDQGFDEIIVYDDASTEPYPFDPIDQLPEVKFYRGEKNGGAGYARNRLLELASSDYIHFHDIDDTKISVHFLTELMPYLSPNTVVFSSWRIWWLDGQEPKLYDYPDFDTVTDFREYFLRHHVHMNACLYPRDLALKVKFDEDFRALQDLLFNLRLAQAGAIFQHINGIFAEHEKNIESTISRMKQRTFQEYRARYCQRCREILPKQYHPMIGDIALFHAWNACLQGFDHECQLSIEVAKECGKLNYAQFGQVVALIAPWLGLNHTLKIRRWWFKHYVKNQRA